jgi:iron(III) transport system ATP-binding protein
MRDVSKSFGRYQAVSGVSFKVPEGSFTTLLGESGSGKSTTLRMLAGLERADRGEIILRSEVVNSSSVFVPPERRRLGMVFQSYALWPQMTVFDHVAYPLRVQRDKRNLKARVLQALDLVGLADLGHRYPAELSGGQQQRVALARAIVYEPPVLLLDEPLSNLDAKLRHHMRVELKRLHDRLKISTIFVTHDQLEALSLSDQVIVMSNGRLVEQGTPRDIYESPRCVESATFVGASNVFPGTVRAEDDAAHVVVELDDGTEIRGLRSNATVDLENGLRVVVGVKPEDVLVGATVVEGASLEAKGEIVEVSYFGSHVDVTVQTGASTWRVRAAKTFDVPARAATKLTVREESVSIYPIDNLPMKRE